MRAERQQARHRQIADAAYALLQSVGYRATSMLAIARQAGASNETLYRWYGNKQGLFRTLVEDNAAEVRDLLQARLEEDAPPLAALSEMAPLLLKLVTAPRAVALNRAAAAEVGRWRGQPLGPMARTLWGMGCRERSPGVQVHISQGRWEVASSEVTRKRRDLCFWKHRRSDRRSQSGVKTCGSDPNSRISRISRMHLSLPPLRPLGRLENKAQQASIYKK